MDCVSPVQCGCSMGSRYHPAREAFWAGEHCKKFCHREASTHTVHCSPSCGLGQRCGTLRGIFGCHPLSPGICQTTMHSHIASFDRKTVEFPGTCASVFTKSCGSSREQVQQPHCVHFKDVGSWDPGLPEERALT
uniref:VWFD domain-containing protein n=1 Tax=Mandrillus leucophaeus TaxID=9568 RepID=A0A2K6AKH3_MANLE